jgi:hypothetical protein
MPLPKTLLPLSRFAQIVGYSPMLFNQVYVPDLQDGSSCSDPVLQYAWQPAGGGRPGRDEVAQAVQLAEQMITGALGFSPAPDWVVEDAVPVAWSRQMPWRVSARASRGYIIEGGIEAWSVIQAARTIAWSDADGDTYKETGTVTATLPSPAPPIEEIALVDPDGIEIRPIQVTYAGGIATIRFARYEAVLRNLQERLDANAVDGTADANFASTMDVMRHYTDPSVQAVLRWESGICDANGCSVSEQTACFIARDSRLPLVGLHAGMWDTVGLRWVPACPAWWRPSDGVKLNYYAGLRYQPSPRDMNPQLAKAISVLALCLMDRTWDCCEFMRNVSESWRTDLSLRSGSMGGSTSYAVTRESLDNPFGSTRGAVFAWRVVQQYRLGDPVLS